MYNIHLDAKLNELVYVTFPYYRMVLPCKIVEINNIYTGPESDHDTIWGSITPDGFTANIPTGEKDENGWNVYRNQDHLDDNYQLVNQFIWVDEPIGHAIQIYDEAYYSLDEALSCLLPSKKKHLKRRLQTMRKRAINFVASTHGAAHATESQIEMWKMFNHPKKVYVKRK